MPQVIGYEGTSRGYFGWSTAIVLLDDGETVLNPTTKQTCSLDHLKSLIPNQATKLKEPISIDPSTLAQDLILVRVDVRSQFFESLLVGEGDFLVRHTTTQTAYYVLERSSGFARYTDKVLEKITTLLCVRADSCAGQSDLFKLGFTIKPSDPKLNALSVHAHQNHPNAKTIATALVGRSGNNEDMARFTDLLQTLTSHGPAGLTGLQK